jgi:hypothetical protein
MTPACVPGSGQVLGGADLFLQGLIVPPGGLGEWSAGDVRALAIPENPFPFAVRLHLNRSNLCHPHPSLLSWHE